MRRNQPARCCLTEGIYPVALLSPAGRKGRPYRAWQALHRGAYLKCLHAVVMVLVLACKLVCAYAGQAGSTRQRRWTMWRRKRNRCGRASQTLPSAQLMPNCAYIFFQNVCSQPQEPWVVWFEPYLSMSKPRLTTFDSNGVVRAEFCHCVLIPASLLQVSGQQLSTLSTQYNQSAALIAHLQCTKNEVDGLISINDAQINLEDFKQIVIEDGIGGHAWLVCRYGKVPGAPMQFLLLLKRAGLKWVRGWGHKFVELLLFASAGLVVGEHILVCYHIGGRHNAPVS